ncbi:hypothetical protein M993_04616 [Obesumbacterium proteus ATCC 12841]|uniref:Uncharacterized protein n=1 Tax=Obesumbacterium proteus ATCC 12841 TaxID=1354268 RepID=A0AA91ECG1_9GAMM|nr:hypothetical protein M993_04616 [Obesumbacterium proteus ATCC 12841]
MEFAPHPASVGTMLPDFPFTFAEDFQGSVWETENIVR